jgi:hypothetical protein
MTTRKQREKREDIIDLVDFSGMNRTNAIRDTSPRSRLDLKTDYLGGFDSSGIEVIPEDRGYSDSKQQKSEPADPEPQEDERLEAEGAQIINSSTYFPASKTTLTKRSQTPEERAMERERERERKHKSQSKYGEEISFP